MWFVNKTTIFFLKSAFLSLTTSKAWELFRLSFSKRKPFLLMVLKGLSMEPCAPELHILVGTLLHILITFECFCHYPFHARFNSGRSPPGLEVELRRDQKVHCKKEYFSKLLLKSVSYFFLKCARQIFRSTCMKLTMWTIFTISDLESGSMANIIFTS